MRGTTLVELLVVLAVLGTALGVAGLGVRALDPPPDAAALVALRDAREQAIRTGRPVTAQVAGTALRFAPDGRALGGPIVLDSLTLVVDPLTGSVRRARR